VLIEANGQIFLNATFRRCPQAAIAAQGVERFPAGGSTNRPIWMNRDPYVIIEQDSDNMIRTQISLDEHEYKIAKKEARTLGISVAEFVRRALREALPPRGQGPWMKYAGVVETGNPRSSRSIDEIVYGQRD
jgi:hypothetical protein